MASTSGAFDPIALARLLRTAYTRLRDAPGEFQRLRTENEAMIYILGQVIRKAESCALDQDTSETFSDIMKACEETADDLQYQLSNYTALSKGWRGTVASRVWKRARWVAGMTRDAKQQLMMHIIMLSTVKTDIEQRIQKVELEEKVQNLRAAVDRHMLGLRDEIQSYRRDMERVQEDLDANVELLRNEISLERDARATPEQMSQMAQRIKDDVLSKINQDRRCSLEVRNIVEAAFGTVTASYEPAVSSVSGTSQMTSRQLSTADRPVVRKRTGLSRGMDDVADDSVDDASDGESGYQSGDLNDDQGQDSSDNEY